MYTLLNIRTNILQCVHPTLTLTRKKTHIVVFKGPRSIARRLPEGHLVGRRPRRHVLHVESSRLRARHRDGLVRPHRTDALALVAELDGERGQPAGVSQRDRLQCNASVGRVCGKRAAIKWGVLHAQAEQGCVSSSRKVATTLIAIS